MRNLVSLTCFFSVLTAAALFACSSSTNQTTPQGSADGGVSQEGGESGDASDDDAGPRDLGGIFAISDSVTVDGGPSGLHRAGAFFTHVNGIDTTTTSKTVGPCVIETIGNGNAPSETDFSAGTLHISGGVKTIDLTPTAQKAYDPVSGNTSLWSGGEMLTVAAEGKDVPAFTVTLVAPSKLTMTAPALPQGASNLSVTRSAPFSATWTGASSGQVVLYFDAATGANAFSATCTFDASTLKAEVPAAAFADFPAQDGTFNFYTKQAAVASPPGWTVRFTASSAIVDKSGASATGYATFK